MVLCIIAKKKKKQEKIIEMHALEAIESKENCAFFGAYVTSNNRNSQHKWTIFLHLILLLCVSLSAVDAGRDSCFVNRNSQNKENRDGKQRKTILNVDK